MAYKRLSGLDIGLQLAHTVPLCELWKGAPFSWLMPPQGSGLAREAQAGFQPTYTPLSGHKLPHTAALVTQPVSGRTGTSNQTSWLWIFPCSILPPLLTLQNIPFSFLFQSPTLKKLETSTMLSVLYSSLAFFSLSQNNATSSGITASIPKN